MATSKLPATTSCRKPCNSMLAPLQRAFLPAEGSADFSLQNCRLPQPHADRPLSFDTALPNGCRRDVAAKRAAGSRRSHAALAERLLRRAHTSNSGSDALVATELAGVNSSLTASAVESAAPAAGQGPALPLAAETGPGAAVHVPQSSSSLVGSCTSICHSASMSAAGCSTRKALAASGPVSVLVEMAWTSSASACSCQSNVAHTDMLPQMLSQVPGRKAHRCNACAAAPGCRPRPCA